MSEWDKHGLDRSCHAKLLCQIIERDITYSHLIVITLWKNWFGTWFDTYSPGVEKIFNFTWKYVVKATTSPVNSSRPNPMWWSSYTTCSEVLNYQGWLVLPDGHNMLLIPVWHAHNHCNVIFNNSLLVFTPYVLLECTLRTYNITIKTSSWHCTIIIDWILS